MLTALPRVHWLFELTSFCIVNVELCRKALEKVGDPRILVNLVSRRVRQLNGGGGYGRPLIDPDPTYGTADIALQEIVDDKITWEYVEIGRAHV